MAKTLDQALEKLRKRAAAAGPIHEATFQALDEHFSEVARELQVTRDLDELRKQKRISQRELSRLSEVDQAEVSRILAGRTSPRIPTVQKLARALGAELRVVPLVSAKSVSEGRWGSSPSKQGKARSKARRKPGR